MILELWNIHLGSPPLTRGKPPLSAVQWNWMRITPAHAGKTHLPGTRHGKEKDHPRSRGENGSARVSVPATLGSPPLTRGKPDGNRNIFRHTGITPAHAGKTHRVSYKQSQEEDHPRSRGENDQHSLGCELLKGSPPLTRGKHNIRKVPLPDLRITPAHAGKT